MSPVKAILIDLDGTIINIPETFKRILTDLEIPIHPFDNTACYLAGVEMGKLLSYLISDPSYSYDKAYDYFMKTYAEQMERYIVFYPGALETLRLFDKHKIRWGIVSNKKHEWCEDIVNFYNLKPEVTLGAGIIPHKKPHPAPLLYAANKLNLRSDECLYVGDMPTDLRAASLACMEGIYAKYGCYHFIDPHFKATKSIDYFSQIINLCNLEFSAQ